MSFDVIKFLDDKALSEQEKCKAFRERLKEYCSKGYGIFSVFRMLKNIEDELEMCLNSTIHVNADKSTVERFLRIIRIELRINGYRMMRPELSEDSITAKFPIGEWTDNKADLIELVYALSAKHSVEHGNASVKSIKEGFEYIFGLDLGNIHDRLDDIASRKERRTRYLEKLLESLNKFLDDLDD
jgi:hypothetical protein